MKILFLHQNFPAQFRALAQRLADNPAHDVRALRLGPPTEDLQKVAIASYPLLRRPLPTQHPLLIELETKLLRAEAVAQAARALDAQGWQPDLVIAHPGWGEALLIRTVWPRVKLVCHLEYFYAPTGQDFNFDPEFSDTTTLTAERLRLKNMPMLHALQDADAFWASTDWQRSLFPDWVQPRIERLAEGVDTDFFRPDPKASFEIPGTHRRLSAADEVLTFTSRSLEPARGFHVFMRMLPDILQRRPRAEVIILGHEKAAYGPEPAGHASWLRAMLAELGDRIDPARVHVPGLVPREAYRSVLQISRAHACLSYPFPLSGSALEALACGTRLVGSRTGPISEVMPADSDAYLRDFFDLPGLTQAFCEALGRNARQRTADRSAARRHAMEKFALKRTTDAMTAFLARVTAPKASDTVNRARRRRA